MPSLFTLFVTDKSLTLTSKFKIQQFKSLAGMNKIKKKEYASHLNAQKKTLSG